MPRITPSPAPALILASRPPNLRGNLVNGPDDPPASMAATTSRGCALLTNEVEVAIGPRHGKERDAGRVRNRRTVASGCCAGEWPERGEGSIMRRVVLGIAVLTAIAVQPRVAAAADPAADLRAGKGFIATPLFSEEADRALLALFAGLRVADVVDRMDAAGLFRIGLMDAGIRPLWKDAATFRHRFAGIAVTARYVPTQRPPAGKRAAAVARYARTILNNDREGRRDLYLRRGLPTDPSVR